ncbi:carboxypeptidase-like regulatory domain-containing protein [uncultured Croceitalea sp.]|uniref:carboxypeptidase-like regulatory domain-containing protein n=1 Tax=uncultured Croceitalea sp. TaxID=1798908 RepID=UPI0033060F63
MRFIFTLVTLCHLSIALAQNEQHIRGIIKDAKERSLLNVSVGLDGTAINTTTDEDGNFNLVVALRGEFILSVSKTNFVPKKIPISLDGNSIGLGTIVLESDITLDKSDNLITLTDGDLSDDTEFTSSAVGLLQATRDVFLNRAAFDFGQAFFRVRGYDAREGQVFINGLPVNKLFSGRPDWNNWGGLNDVIRNQEFTNGLASSDYTFGGILGNTNMDMRPTGLRPGLRLSSSISNRTYTGRLMATYTKALSKKGVAYTFSASRRWANQGYIEGTLYDAFSYYGAIEYKLHKNHSLGVTGMLAKNRRGRSSAITEEVFQLGGKQYNPYWGNQNGKIRNSRDRTSLEPIFTFNHYYKTTNFKLTSGLAYQFGTRSRSRLGYFNAPNPDPTYFRYLPSFYINNRVGADFTNANLAKEGFLNNRQINWAQLYTANAQNEGKAVYILSDDISDDNSLTLASTGNLKINESLGIDFGYSYRYLRSKNYAKLNDLLGADFHEDKDPFSDTINDTNGALHKVEGDTFGYNYELNASVFNSFTQLKFSKDRWSTFLSCFFENSVYQREGKFQNERFLSNSLGLGENLNFNDYGLKAGVSYTITGRHWVKANAAQLTRPPLMQNTFVNPRENNAVVNNIQSEKLTSFDLNYFLRLPDISARLTGFYTRFQNATDINFFFVDAGVGSDFVQEVLTDLDKLHMGAELGLTYEASSSVKLSFVANIGNYVYASNPNVTINFDTAGAEEDIINPEGNVNLGTARIKGLKLAQGPQKALALGIEYRDPKYWWVGATANYLTNNYAGISAITRTQSFFLNPDTRVPFPNATPENVNALLQQNPLDSFYLLNLVGGKSWLKNGTYISVFASINNAFDATFRTGGYEQSRNGNFGQLLQDSLRDNPSFAPKYWYGFGRTFFLNFAISF